MDIRRSFHLELNVFLLFFSKKRKQKKILNDLSIPLVNVERSKSCGVDNYFKFEFSPLEYFVHSQGSPSMFCLLVAVGLLLGCCFFHI